MAHHPPSGLSFTISQSTTRPAPAIHALISKELRPRHCGLPIVDKIRDQIVQQGGLYGFRTLDRMFCEIDRNNDRVLSRVELADGLQRLGVNPSQFEMDTLMRQFDSDLDNCLSRREFVEGISYKAGEHRRRVILDLLALLQKVCRGPVTVKAMAALFDAAHHPLVEAGKVSEEQARADMVASWDKPESDPISMEEFVRYWVDVSAAVDDDDWFELCIRNPWHLSGGKGISQNTSCRRVQVVHTDGRRTMEVVTDDLGIGPEDTAAMLSRLREQGVTDAKAVELM